MNLAFLTNEYPNIIVGQSGGIGTSIKNLAQSYIKLGHSVFVFVIHKKFEDFCDEGVSIISICTKINLRGIIGVYLKSKDVEKQINKYILEYDIKYIEIPDWCGIAAFMNFKCKTVIKYNGSDAYFCFIESRKQKWKNYFYEYINIRKANVHISVSKFTAEMTKKIFHLSNKHFHIIPNALNIEKFSPIEFVFLEETDEPVILYLGTLIRKKGCLEIPHIFNEVLRKTPNAKLFLVGRDNFDIYTGEKSTWELMKPLFNKIENVKYFGLIPYNEVRNVIAKAHVCIFPSYAEALPMSWLEAMAMQKAIVASDIGWAKEIVDDGVNGFIVNPKNYEFYALKISNLLEDNELRNTIGINARQKIKDSFDIMMIAKKHLEIFL